MINRRPQPRRHGEPTTVITVVSIALSTLLLSCSSTASTGVSTTTLTTTSATTATTAAAADGPQELPPLPVDWVEQELMVETTVGTIYGTLTQPLVQLEGIAHTLKVDASRSAAAYVSDLPFSPELRDALAIWTDQCC